MSVEIPSDLIRRIQTTTRKNAGIPSSSDNPSTSLRDAISSLDADCPSNLRCSKCQRGAGLIRGELSTLCIFCGHGRSEDGLTQSISFSSTVACKKLFESLKLDGTEVINFSESNDSNKGQDTKHDGLVLSNLLDFELKWPSEKEEAVNRSSNNAPLGVQAVNLSGVDLDTFFSGSKNLTTSSTPSVTPEEWMPTGQIISMETHVSSGSETFDFFNNLQTPNMAVSSDNNTGDVNYANSFADWETGFQSASSEVFHAEAESISAEFPSSMTVVGVASESKSVDIFEGSITEVSSHTTPASTFKEHKNVEHEISSSREPKYERGDFSSGDDWIQDDLWPNTADQLKRTSETSNSELKYDAQHMTSTSEDWAPDDMGATSSMGASNIKSKHHGGGGDDDDDVFDDSLDSWQDFASSNEVVGVLPRVQPDSEITSNEHAVDLEEVEFGNFLQTDSFSGAVGELRGPKETKVTKSKHIDGDDVFDEPLDSLQEFSTSNAATKHGDDVFDDPLDSWQDFSTTNEATRVSSSSCAESGNEITSNGHASTPKSVELQDMEFGNCMQTDSFPEALGKQGAPKEMEDIESRHVDDDVDVFDDSLDSWHDFASSNEVPGVSSSSWARSGEEITPGDHVSTLKSVDQQDVEFSNFLQPNSFSGISGEQRGPTEMNDVQINASASTNNKDKFINTKSNNGNSMEPWKDATNLSGISGDLSDLWSQTTMESTSNKHALGTKSMDPQDMEFGSFLHSDLFSGPLSGQKELTEANTIKLDAPFSTNINKCDQSGDNDDSWDDWQDFTSSMESHGNLSSLLTLGAESTSSENASGAKSVDPRDSEFGNFAYSDLFSRVDGQKGSADMNNIQLESLISKPSAEFKGSNHIDNDNYDLFKSWEGLTSLSAVPEGSSKDTNVSMQAGTKVTSYEHTSGIKSVDFEDMEFGNFLQLEVFPGMKQQEGCIKMNDVHIDDLVFTSSINELNNTNNTNDNNDPFEAWLDFASSNDAQRSSTKLSAEPDNRATPYERASGTRSLDPQDVDSFSFLHSNSLAGQRGSSEVNDLQNSSVSYRMNGTDENVLTHPGVPGSAETYKNNSNASNLESSQQARVEKLLSQMPDLSFMLDDRLSIPKKVDSDDLKS